MRAKITIIQLRHYEHNSKPINKYLETTKKLFFDISNSVKFQVDNLKSL